MRQVVKNTFSRQPISRQTESSFSKKWRISRKTIRTMLLRFQAMPKTTTCTSQLTIRILLSPFWLTCQGQRPARFSHNSRMTTSAWQSRSKWCKRDWFSLILNLFSSNRRDSQQPRTSTLVMSSNSLMLSITQPITRALRPIMLMKPIKHKNIKILYLKSTTPVTSPSKISTTRPIRQSNKNSNEGSTSELIESKVGIPTFFLNHQT